MFLISLIIIMLVQSAITIGTLIVRRTAETLEEYSGNMMSRLVENRGVILQNDMNQRWASVHEQETLVNQILKEYLDSKAVGLKTFLDSSEMKNELLALCFPKCLNVLQNNSTTGIFVILSGENAGSEGELEGFFIRDSDPDTNPANYTDLLLERGNKELSRTWGIPLDTNWTTQFHMDGRGENGSDHYFYEPLQAGEDFPDADTVDLGYWSLPFCLEKDKADPHEMITYSFPLRYEGKTYGVMGVEISSRSLYDYFPVAELNDSQQSGYLLSVRDKDGRYTPLVGKGMLYDLVRQKGGGLSLKETNYQGLCRVQGVKLGGQGIYAVVRPLKLYSNHVPYENTEWALLGLNTEEDLFGMSRQLYIWMVVAVLTGLIFGVIGIYLLVRHLTRPVQQLMRCISGGAVGLQAFKPSNILEIDALYEVVVDLTEKQKKSENILLEEKERYKVALESSKDIFFSFDLQNQVLDIVNHPTMSGQWKCSEYEGGFIAPEYIHEADRTQTMEALKCKDDELYSEFRLRWPKDTDYMWVALTGKAVYDTDGKRWKLVGSIRDIQEQKEREAEQRRKNMTDSVTGLYVYSAGIGQIMEYRRSRPEGVMVSLFVDQLRQTNEKNGIVFGDMLLEELGLLVQESCRALTVQTGCAAIALRLNRDELVLWLEGQTKEQAGEFVRSLLDASAACFSEDTFPVRVYAGLAFGGEREGTEQLIRMAKQAQGLARSGADGQPLLYGERSGKNRAVLPPLQAHETNTLGDGEDVSLVSVALNLFGRGGDFQAQMILMIRKIGRSYQADGVLVSLLRADFNSNYLNYQWYPDGRTSEKNVNKYTDEEKENFFLWLGSDEVRYFTREDSSRQMFQCFLNVSPGQEGIVLPMYDSGSYMGNVCILGVSPTLLEDAEEYQNLAELGRVIQGQLNQQQHDIASKAKSEFLSRMSHEIRTPMNGIIGMTAIALQKEQSQERVMDCLQKIQSSSNYLLGLINDILDMSKIESGKMKLEPFDFDMREMLDTIRELVMPQMTAKKIEFVQEISLEHTWFLADRMRISQVLINLLGNAVKFTPERGKITLTVREDRVSGGLPCVYFAVCDTGIGIAKEEQDRVFRSFEQASGVNPAKQQGTGLGLSISSRLVQLMGSSIRLESAPGEGSTFSFSIPLTPGKRIEAATKTDEISFAGYRILVVEDNELNAEIAQCLLEERNFEVECVYDGAQAVERMRAVPPGTYDVILMDIMMPVMDGLDATRAIRSMEREDCRTIPIIAMSANAFDDDLKKSVECGMNGHLSKPVEVDKLYQVLNEVLH